MLKLPGIKNIFKNHPKIGQVLKNKGQRNVFEDDNDTIQAKIDDSITDTRQVSTSSTTYVTKKTITFTPSASNNIILAVKAVFEIKVTYNDPQYGVYAKLLGGTEVVTSSQTYQSKTSWIQTTQGGQSSYTYRIQMKVSGPDVTGYLRNAEITVYYLEDGIVTADSSKFGSWS